MQSLKKTYEAILQSRFIRIIDSKEKLRHKLLIPYEPVKMPRCQTVARTLRVQLVLVLKGAAPFVWLFVSTKKSLPL